LVDDAAQIHFRDDFDDARTADAGNTSPGDGCVEPWLVGPQVRADDLESGLQRDRIDTHAFDGARSCALTTADLRSLERRPCRARAGEQASAIAQYYFGVRPDIDQQS